MTAVTALVVTAVISAERTAENLHISTVMTTDTSAVISAVMTVRGSIFTDNHGEAQSSPRLSVNFRGYPRLFPRKKSVRGYPRTSAFLSAELSADDHGCFRGKITIMYKPHVGVDERDRDNRARESRYSVDALEDFRCALVREYNVDLSARLSKAADVALLPGPPDFTLRCPLSFFLRLCFRWPRAGTTSGGFDAMRITTA